MKKILALVLAAMMIFSLAACGSAAAPSASSEKGTENAGAVSTGEETYVIKLGGGHGPTSSLTQCWNDVFIPRVAELTNGRVMVEHFENDSIGVETDRIEQTQLGTLQMTYISEAASSIDPTIGVLAMPFLFQSEEHYDAVIDGDVGKQIYANLENYGLHPMGYLENGFRVLTNSKHEVHSLADLAGLKIRVSQSDIPIATFQALGANTVAMSFGELYSALQTGTVDGQENAFNTIASAKLYEVQKYFTETNHLMGSFIVVANADWFSSLPADIQEAIQTAVEETSAYQREIYRAAVDSDRQACIDGGMTGATVDTAEWIAATESVYSDIYKIHPEYEALVNAIRDLA